jgi:tRNA (guanine-N1)-methyltransferase
VGLRIDIVTIFPAYFDSPLGVSLIGKAAARGDIEFRVHDLRSWATDVHHTVDDLPFGGGPGMVMKPDVCMRPNRVWCSRAGGTRASMAGSSRRCGRACR